MLSFIKKRKEQKGFTLIEVMLVVAMIAMLASMTIPISFGSLKKQSVEEESSKLLGVLRQTQAKSMEGRDDSLWGVYFTPESYTVFKGNSYEEREPVYDEVFELSSDINVAGAPEIVFDYQGIPRIKGLVGHWTMNEGEGDVAHDLSGNDNHGTLVNDPTWADGKVGGALDFDGSDDYVDCGNDASLNITDAITISAWVNIPVGSDGGKGIIQKYPTNDYDYMFYISTTGGPAFYFKNSSGTSYIAHTAVDLRDSNWHYLVGTFDGQYLKFYTDYIFKYTTNTGGTTIRVTPDQPLHIMHGFGSYANGLIDDVRIYNRALTEDEIRLMYESGLDGVDDNIIELSGGGESAKINIGRQGRIEIVR